ncbi:MAG: ATP-dependent DNA helicase, partial [Myxococcota bacterium]
MSRLPTLEGGGAGRAAVEGPGFPARLVGAMARLDLREETLLLAEELAGLPADLSPERRRALMHLIVASMVSLSRGSTRLPLTGEEPVILGPLLEQLGLTEDERGAVERLASALVAEGPGDCAAVVGHADAHRPLLAVDGHLYHHKSWVLEGRVAQRLSERLGAPLVECAAEAAVADVEADPPRVGGRRMKLSSEQRAAITLALRAPLSVISGGPGTGKTSIVVSILRALSRLAEPPLESVVLAAPTGKAADRMRQSVAGALGRLTEPAFADRALLREPPPALTLHRLLGYSPRTGRYRHHERNPIHPRFVVVDESSMIDLALMDRLLRALPSDGRLVLLGDARQLPSVDAGAVFRDLSGLGGERMVTLTHSYRMDPSDPAGRHILGTAMRVDASDADGLLEPRSGKARVAPIRVASHPGDVTFDGVELVEATGSRDRQAVFERWAEHQAEALPDRTALVQRTWPLQDGRLEANARADMERLFDHHERFRVLCLTVGRATGVDALNDWFRAWDADGGRRAGPGPGTPLMVLRNDYDRGLFNGDQGLALRSDEGPVAVFRRDATFAAFPLESVQPIVGPAWAITVHKAQGSECDHGMVVLPDTDTPLLTRELLYTALTRSRRSVLLVGARQTLRTGV